MKTIAIIGSNGVLGADLVRTLKSSYNILPINRDNYTEMKGVTCDIVVNANGNSKRFWANEHIIEDFEASTASVYKSILDFTFKKYIYISSSDVYADHTRPDTTSEDQTIHFQELSPYGFHKYLSETIVTKYAEDYIILRSSLMLGSNLRKGPIYDLLHQKPLFIALDSQIQMITTAEISAIIDYMITNSVSKKTFNMGGIGTVDFRDIETYVKKKPRISENSQTQKYEMDVTELAKVYKLKQSSYYLKTYINNLH